MTSMLRIDHHYTIRPKKAYTNFMWSFEDWLLFCNSERFKSREFVLHETDGKTCKLTLIPSNNRYYEEEWVDDPDDSDRMIPVVREDSTAVEITFPMGLQYDVMEASLSCLDENLVKLITVKDTFSNSQKTCTLMFTKEVFSNNASTYLRNHTLTLFVEITVVKSLQDFATCTDIWDADFGSDIYKNFKVILDSKDLYDVTFIVEGQKLHAHKLILAANSEVFRAMFTREMKERKDDCVKIVDTDATVFKAFLCYMYTGRVSEIENVVDELIVVADKYQVMKLKKCCERHMSAHINNDSAVAYLLKAYHLSCTKLQKECAHFVRANIHVLGEASVRAKLSEYPNIVSEVFDEKPSA